MHVIKLPSLGNEPSDEREQCSIFTYGGEQLMFSPARLQKPQDFRAMGRMSEGLTIVIENN